MADLVITAANVIAGDNADIEYGRAGAAITAGMAVYLNETTRKYPVADNNSATASARRARGIALNGAADGQPLAIIKGGPLTIGATLTPGTAYYLGESGAICPASDLGAGEYVCLLGIAASASVLNVDIQFPNVAL